MATLLGSLLLGACSAFGIRSGTEEPRHSTVERLGDVEIRRYAPRLAAETSVPGDAYHARGEGFRRLAGYIFGGNERCSLFDPDRLSACQDRSVQWRALPSFFP